MKSALKVIGILFVVMLSLYCNNTIKPNTTENDLKSLENDVSISEIPESTFEPDRLDIEITPGLPIKDYPEYLKESELKNGEGTFKVFTIEKNGESIGYTFPDPNDDSKTGEIVITSKTFKTAKGIQIGTTYNELKDKLDNFEVHGSEIESRTYVTNGAVSYQLDFPSNQYNLDKNSVFENAKVVQIILNR